MNAQQALVRARTLAEAGRLELAKDALQTELAGEALNPDERVDVLVTLADLQAASDEPDAARANLREALDLMARASSQDTSARHVRAESLLAELDDDPDRDDPIEFAP